MHCPGEALTFQPTLPARGATPFRIFLCGLFSYFNPRSPHGERRSSPSALRHGYNYFNPRSPHGERRQTAPTFGRPILDFNPRSPHGERLAVARDSSKGGKFQPTLPARGATFYNVCYSSIAVFQPTLPARGATDSPWTGLQSVNISTHAPRTGSDANTTISLHGERNFNPRSPHGERLSSCLSNLVIWGFQPTLPARGATASISLLPSRREFQPTLPARGATPHNLFQPPVQGISTHAPRTGSDKTALDAGSEGAQFQPTLPARGATRLHNVDFSRFVKFQPTLPARGATQGSRRLQPKDCHFNPRSPHGERRVTCKSCPSMVAISTHAPRTGSDHKCQYVINAQFHFNPRSPHGERHRTP